MATRCGAAYSVTQPGRFDGLSRNASGIGTANGWQRLCVFPGSRLPRASAPVVWVVMGSVGHFALDGTDRASAELMLVTSAGQWITGTRHSHSAQDPYMGFGTGRGAPFMMIYDGGTWSSAVDLELWGRIFDESTTPFPSASAECGAVVALAFDTGNLGASSWLLAASSPGSTSLPYENAPDAQLLLSGALPWTSGTQRWLTFYTAKTVPHNVNDGYTCWMQLLNNTWGAVVDSWNDNAAGLSLRGPAHLPLPVNKGEWMGGFRVFDVDAANRKVGILGRCNYTTGLQAINSQAIVFAARVDDLEGFNEHHEARLSMYGLTPGHGTGIVQNIREFTIADAPVADLIWLSQQAPEAHDLTGFGGVMHLVMNESRILNGPDPQSIYVHRKSELPVQLSGGITIGNKGLSFFDHRGYRKEWESREQLSLDSLIGGIVQNETLEGVALTLGAVTGSFSANQGVVGQTSGATAVLLAGASGLGPHTIAIGSYSGTFLPGEIIDNRLGATAPLTALASTATMVALGPASGGGVKTIPVGSIAGTFTVNQTLRGRVSNSRSRYLSIFAQPTSYFAQHWQALIFGMHRGAVSTPVPAESAGPTVVITPGREAPALGSLSALPIQPSYALRERLVSERTELQTPLGYSITWPRFSTPRSERTFVWEGLTKTQRDTLLAFFEGLSVAAFKWTPPHLTETAFVAVSHPTVTDVGLLHTVSIDVVELKWIGP